MQLAQVNIARLLEPLDAPRLHDFVAALGPLNALADAATGFVWRLQTDDGDATAIRAVDDDMVIVNLSVWTSVEVLAAYVYGAEHLAVMRRRREWFTRPWSHHLALWWVPDDHRPTPLEARERLEHLERCGPTPQAFTFSTAVGPTDTSPQTADGSWLCPA